MLFKKQCPSAEYLNHRYSYDHESGIIYHKNPIGSNVKSGDPVYCCNTPSGYKRLTIEVDKKRHNFMLARIVWKMYTGEDVGKLDIDHIDGNKTNNAISNLRLANRSQNQYNRPYAKGYRRSSHKKDKPCSAGGYEVFLSVDGTSKYFGTFTCPLIARVEYTTLKKQIAKEFAPA